MGSSQFAPMRVKPVLQYYAYLNLAVAVVLIYRPADYQQYRTHGAEDVTRSLNKIGLSTPVVKVRNGALSLFHSILAEGLLPREKLSLKDLLVAVPMVAEELFGVFGLEPTILKVEDTVSIIGAPDEMYGDDHSKVHSCFSFEAMRRDGTPLARGFPLRRMYSMMPALKSEYVGKKTSPTRYEFISNQGWTLGNQTRAERFHADHKLRLVNFGGHSAVIGGKTEYAWNVEPGTPILPTLSAALILSFTLSSLCRYRANILERVENSKVNLLCEVFASEADGFIIPAMRNLLYAENLSCYPAPLT